VNFPRSENRQRRIQHSETPEDESGSSGNVLESLPDSLENEVFERFLQRDGVEIERIISHGQASPPGSWYDQERHEWVMVLRGEAGLEFEGRKGILELRPGSWVDIPAHQRHRVAWTSEDEPTVWLAVHFGG